MLKVTFDCALSGVQSDKCRRLLGRSLGQRVRNALRLQHPSIKNVLPNNRASRRHSLKSLKEAYSASPHLISISCRPRLTMLSQACNSIALRSLNQFLQCSNHEFVQLGEVPFRSLLQLDGMGRRTTGKSETKSLLNCGQRGRLLWL